MAPERRAARRKASRRQSRKRDDKYRHPVPEPRVIIEALEKKGVPVDLVTLAGLLGVRDERSVRALKRRLQKMSVAGQLLVNRKGEYCLLQKLDALTGTVSAHADGYGFLTPDDGSDDVYLRYQEMRQLLDGDRVAVRFAGSGRAGKRAGELVEILERGKETAVGRYKREHGIGFVIESGRSPHQFLIPDHQRGGARDGQIVKIQITEYPRPNREALGKVIAILGDAGEPGIVTEVAIEQFNLPARFSEAAIAVAESWGDRVRVGDKRDRVDLRETPLVTIDGADARDFDDAVFAERDGDGWRLIVAIADVSHYVRPGDELDEEAQLRGTSVYFPDRVLPMLPESLSNGLCSLNPAVDRLCMACDMQIGAGGKVKKARFYRAVMRSAARLTYSQVDRSRRRRARGSLARLQPQLDALYSVYRLLLQARRRRGALDLDLPEARIEMNSAGEIERIVRRQRTDAHRLIEECMIAANVEAGKLLRRHRLTTLFRVHSGPPDDKFEALRLLLQELGIRVTAEAQRDPRHLNRVLEAITRRNDSRVLAMAVLRSLSQAAYQPANQGHFGLALDVYAHFTSPIRRYPDLLVHRGITHILEKGKPGAFDYDAQAMERHGKRCSEQERRAEEASRHVEARHKCAYMQQHVGEVFSGTVTGVTHFGLFASLDELLVEGLVHVTSLHNDYYHAEHGGLRLTGERTGASFALGDSVQVKVLRVDVDEAKLDLAMVNDG